VFLMGKFTCPHCKKKIPKDSITCPKCFLSVVKNEEEVVLKKQIVDLEDQEKVYENVEEELLQHRESTEYIKSHGDKRRGIRVALGPNLLDSITPESYKIALELGQQGRLEECLHYFDLALEEAPNMGLILGNKGIALCQLKRYDDAIKCFKKILNRNPEDLFALNNIASSYVTLNKNDEADQYLDKVLTIDPHDSQANYNKGRLLFNQGEFNQAIKFFKESLSHGEKFPITWDYLAKSLQNAGKSEEAQKIYDHILKK
jgi:tetratricopeptide (TPR) repeat protein